MSQKWEELKAKFNNSPYAVLLGMKAVELSQGYAKVMLTVSPQHENWSERTHGGLIMSLADQAFGCAINTLDRVYFAVQFNINFLSTPEKNETLYAEARVLHAGKTTGVAEMSVQDSENRVIAKASGTVCSISKKTPLALHFMTLLARP